MANDFFLKIPSIPGESKDKEHVDWIEVESWGFGISNATDPGRGARATKSVANFSEFSFVKLCDKASPLLFRTCCSGDYVAELTFAAKKSGAKAGQVDYLIIKFTDCLLSNLSQGGGGSDDVMPVENVSFAFSGISFEFKQIDTKGNLSPAAAFKYDLKKNEKL
jgi:type VI secretion system secreted protein Hcp